MNSSGEKRRRFFRFTLRHLAIGFAILGAVFACGFYALRAIPALKVVVENQDTPYNVFLDDIDLGAAPVRLNWHQASRLGFGISPNCEFKRDGIYLVDDRRSDGTIPRLHFRRIAGGSEAWQSVAIKEGYSTGFVIDVLLEEPLEGEH